MLDCGLFVLNVVSMTDIQLSEVLIHSSERNDLGVFTQKNKGLKSYLFGYNSLFLDSGAVPLKDIYLFYVHTLYGQKYWHPLL